MVAKKITIGVSGAILVSALVMFLFMNKAVVKIENTEKQVPPIVRQPQNLTPQKNDEPKFDLYSTTPFDLPLSAIVEISKVSPILKSEIDNILNQAQGFYFLKQEGENRVFIILQNPLSEANVYPRHCLEFVELYLGENGQIVKNIYPPGFNGIDGEIDASIINTNSKPDIWKFDKEIEPYRPIKHSAYDEKGKLRFVEYWNYSDDDDIKYQIKNSKGKTISVFKESVTNESNYRKEHIFYNEDGTIEMNISANYDGPNVTRFSYFNALTPSDCVTIISEFDENGAKIKESLYSTDYQLLKTVKTELVDEKRHSISVYDNEHALIDKIKG